MRGTTTLAAMLMVAFSNAQATEIRMEISHSVRNDTSRPLRDIIADMGPVLSPSADNLTVIENIFLKSPQPQSETSGRGVWLPSKFQSQPSLEVTPPTTVSFNGLGTGNGALGMPPDTNGDVSPTHYIQWINSSWGIFNKTTGAQIGTTVLGNSFWGGFWRRVPDHQCRRSAGDLGRHRGALGDEPVRHFRTVQAVRGDLRDQRPAGCLPPL